MSRAVLPAALSLGLACTVTNPAFDPTSSESQADRGSSDTRGDGDGDPATGDGDGDPSTSDGDGDGDPGTGDGDGDGDGDLCETALTNCDGTCVNLLDDPQNCGMCKVVCAEHHVCVEGDCVEAKYIFATTKTELGSMGGLSGAYMRCEQAAADAPLPGTYLPWLGTAQSPPAAGQSGVGPYVRTDGTIVAYDWSDLTDGELIAPIDRTELGQPVLPAAAPSCGLEYAVWTGTDNAGLWAGDDCGGWADLRLIGTVGDPTSTTRWSTNQLCNELCSRSLPIYCVRQ